MHRRAAPAVILLGTTICLGVACAADPGDPAKTTSGATTGPSGIASSGGGSSSGSGITGGTSSSSGVGTGSGVSTGGTGSSSSGSGSGSGLGSSSGSGAVAGGTSSSSGSSGGAGGGGDGGADATAPGPNCITTPKTVEVEYDTMDKATSTSVQTVAFDLQIVNAGFTAISLSDVTVRYWFTADGNSLAGLTFTSYYSQNGNTTITKDIKATFAAAPPANMSATSDSYLELAFSAASGTLAPLSGSGAQVQVEFNGPYSPPTLFNETNDYSFDPTKKAYAAWTHVTGYYQGQLAWGCEPGPGTAASSGGATGSGAGSEAGSGSEADASVGGSGGGSEAGAGD
jgi:cellulose 1,4-beta-cellobiosidase